MPVIPGMAAGEHVLNPYPNPTLTLKLTLTLALTLNLTHNPNPSPNPTLSLIFDYTSFRAAQYALYRTNKEICLPAATFNFFCFSTYFLQ